VALSLRGSSTREGVRSHLAQEIITRHTFQEFVALVPINDGIKVEKRPRIFLDRRWKTEIIQTLRSKNIRKKGQTRRGVKRDLHRINFNQVSLNVREKRYTP